MTVRNVRMENTALVPRQKFHVIATKCKINRRVITGLLIKVVSTPLNE